MNKKVLDTIKQIQSDFSDFKLKSTDKVKKSVMTGKLKGVDAINTNPLFNGFCMANILNGDKICSECYSVKMLTGIRRNCNRQWLVNGLLLGRERLSLDQIKALRLDSELIRFDAHGELLNPTHLHNLILIAAWYKEQKVALYTKRADMVAEYFTSLPIPRNLTLVYSNPLTGTTTARPKFFDKVFSVFNPAEADRTKTKINCGARSCDTCRICYTKNKIVNVNELIK